jgi:uncharacterized membrane protein
MKTNWRSEIPLLSIVVGMFAVAIALWPFAPEQIPAHWNIHGEVDRFGGKFEGLFLLPLIAVGLYLLMLIVPRFDPGRANYASFAPAYLVIRAAIQLQFAAIYAFTLLSAFGYPINIGVVLPIAMGLLFIVLGNVMGKIRPNWFVGVRTPWTLSSHRSWNKTHRLAGRLFVAMGVVLGACGIVPTPWAFGFAVSMIVVSILWIVVYSYLVWREDPERYSPASISPSNDGNEPV